MKNFDERLQSIQNKTQQLKNQQNRKRLLAGTCTGVFMVALLLTLFVPYSNTPPSVAKYKDSPYYDVIQKLNVFNYRPSQYKNNFQALLGSLGSFHYKGGMLAPEAGNDMSGAASSEISDSNGAYVEVTDNQVAGVIEADIFKRTGQYIFHLYGSNLRIYEIAGDKSTEVYSQDVTQLLPELTGGLANSMDMYLSADGQRLTIIAAAYSKVFHEGVVLLSLDVSDVTKPYVTQQLMFIGNNAQTRMVDGQLLLNYNYNPGSQVDFEKPETYVPQYGWIDSFQCIPGEDILCPDALSSRNYNVLVMLDANTLEVKDTKALLSFSSDIYVSREHVYSMYSYWDTLEENALGDKTQRLKTAVTCIGYTGDGLEVKGQLTVEGRVLSQYCMDEFDGYFRVVTSTQNDRVQKNYGGNAAPDIYWEPGQKSANLYVFSVEDWSLAGKVEDFAPQGEEVTSVRFDGTAAYVCTVERITIADPVFFFDLNDPANIRWSDTGVIDGYSSSLVNFGNGNLVGIGYNDQRNLKIEVYREEGEKVVPVCSFEPELEYGFSEDYKSYYIDRENQLIGLAVWSYKHDELQYILLHFDGNQLVVEKQLSLCGHIRDPYRIRADIIDGFLYILGQELTVTPVRF